MRDKRTPKDVCGEAILQAEAEAQTCVTLMANFRYPDFLATMFMFSVLVSNDLHRFYYVSLILFSPFFPEETKK